jgi:hypothetical protein
MLKNIKNKVSQYKALFLGIFCFGLIWDIFFNIKISDLVVLSLGILWGLIVLFFNFEPQASFVLAAVSYGISFVFQFFNKEIIMEKGASWFFLFFFVGIIHFLVSPRKNK